MLLAAALTSLAGLAALAGTSCSQETRDFEDPGATSTGQGGATGTTTGTGGAGGNGAGGNGTGGGPTVCTPDLGPWDGPLCGPPTRPCALHEDSVLPSPPSFRNDAPAVAVDGVCAPSVAYSVAEGGFFGFYAYQGAQGDWIEEPTPFPFATVSLAAAPDGTAFAVVDDGAFGVTAWNRAAGQWFGGDAVPGQNHAASGGLRRDEGGVLHAALRTSNETIEIGRYDSGWTVTTLNEQTSARIPIALSPGGEEHIAYWASGPSGWELRWLASQGNAEIVAPLGSSLLTSQGQRHGIALTPADGQNPTGRPHIVFARPVPMAPSRQQLAYATRQGAGAWNVFVVDEEDPNGALCDYQPAGPGETCNFDYDEIWPIDVVASQGGDVRLIYEKIRHKGTSVADCIPGGPCYFQVQTDDSTGQVLIGWIDGNQQAGHAPVADAIMARGGTAALDAIGNIHIAVYDTYPPGQGGTTVRYLQIGP